MRLRAALIAVVASAAIPGSAQKPTPPVTPWGAPDLQGVWDFRSLTPMERPKELAGKDVFTNQEAATFAKDSIRRRSRDLDTSGRVVPYNDFWFDEGSKVTSQRTSLIEDPADGRMPPLTPDAEQKRAAQKEARRGVGDDGPHCLERCDPLPELRFGGPDHRENRGRDEALLVEQTVVNRLDVERQLAEVGQADHPTAALECVELPAHRL